MAEDPWQLTASEALKLIHDGQLTVKDYAKSLLARIKDRDATIKAWVYLDEDLILTRAKELDQVPRDKRGPIHGLPVGVKDVILTKDMPTQHNSRIFQGNQPNIDAAPVMNLRATGALIFGKLSTTEFATSKQGNWHQNLTGNAQDPERTPGGSSSGSGAAVGDFQIPVALGTQTGGSVVRPASFNGTYVSPLRVHVESGQYVQSCADEKQGWKPTWGSISREGLAQWSMTLDTCGFFARCVEDLELIADIFRLQDDEPVPQEPFKLQGAKVAFCKTSNWHKAGPGTQKVWTQAQVTLEGQGAVVEDLELPEDFSHVLDWHAQVLAGEGRTSFLGTYLLDQEKLHQDIQGHVENRTGLSKKKQLEAYDNCARLRPVWDDIAARYDLVIAPSVVDEAPLGLENTGDMSFCSMWTMLHVPALNVIGFQGEHSMPIGLTLVGPRYTDRKQLHIARTIGPLFEQEGGWKRQVL